MRPKIRVEIVEHESRVLRGNPLGDPHVRRTLVLLPPSYAPGRRRYPLIMLLTGFTGRGTMAQNEYPWSETFSERYERLLAERRAPEAIVVAPDGFTRYGGSQYVNSAATGRHEDYVAREIVAWADDRYRTIPDPRARAVMGKSSGGYGALMLAMRRPDVFRLCACHSGDAYFEYCYLPDIPKFLAKLPSCGKTVEGFLRHFDRAPQKTMDLVLMMNILAMSSCYSPNPRAKLGFDLPFDPATGALRPDVWKRWLAWDPVRVAPRRVAALRKLDLLFIDCGRRDEFHLQLGARILVDLLKRLRVRHTYEEFDDGHMNISYRYDRSLAAIARTWKRTLGAW